jgi:hypothetical protein
MNEPSSEDEISDSSGASDSAFESSELVSSFSVSAAYAIGTSGEKKQPMCPPVWSPETCSCF